MKIKLSILSILIIVAAATTAFADMGTKANRALREAVGNDGKWKVVALFGYTPLSDELISQAEAEAGTATTPRAFSALRVSQAISAQVGAQAQSNTASNVGTGTGWFKQKTGVDLEFRTIAAGNNITIESDADNVIVGTVNDGNMSAATYDPQAIAGDAFDLALHTGTIAHDSAMITGTGAYSHVDIDSHMDAIADPHSANLTQTNISVTTGTVTTLYNTTFSGSVGTFAGTLGVGGTVTADSFVGDGSGLTGIAGGMAAATYDPQTIAGDAFDLAVHTGSLAGIAPPYIAQTDGIGTGITLAGNTNLPSGIWNSSGDVSIGAAAPNAKLSIFGPTAFSPQTFNYTGGQQTYVVPAGRTSVYITAYGGGSSGKGGTAAGVINVTPGETLYVYIGGANSGSTGGYNGGGAGGTGAGGGGGASDVRRGGTGIDKRVIVAAGGGGSGSGNCGPGGGGGGSSGAAGGGAAGDVYRGGAGGTQNSGGADGAGGAGGSSSAGGGGGGGGGGYYGGGGGGVGDSWTWGASGGGGSSLVPVGGSTTAGVNSGNGYISISPVNALFVSGNSMFSDGNVGIGTPPNNILTLPVASATDPIADAWTLHCLADYKDMGTETTEMIQLSASEKIKTVRVSTFTKRALISDDEAEREIKQKYQDKIRESAKADLELYTTETGVSMQDNSYVDELLESMWETKADRPALVETNRQKLVAEKKALPKFQRKNYGIVAKDAPPEAQVLREDGSLQGVDPYPLISILWANAQRQDERITQLEAQIVDLAARLNVLETAQ